MSAPILTPTVDQALLLLDSARDQIAAATWLPAAWRALWATLIVPLRAALATQTTSTYAALRTLAVRLATGGRNACWAQARTTSDNAIRYQWQSSASAHAGLLRVLITGWPATQTWRNPALPLEYNNLPTTPSRPLTTAAAETAIAVLLQDPLILAPAEALAAMVSTAAGVFISGTFEV